MNLLENLMVSRYTSMSLESWYRGYSNLYINGTYVEHVDISTIQDWSVVKVPYCSWNGDGGVYFFKFFTGVKREEDYVRVFFFTDPDTSTKIYCDSLEYECDDIHLVEYGDAQFVNNEIIKNEEMQAIREAVRRTTNRKMI